MKKYLLVTRQLSVVLSLSIASFFITSCANQGVGPTGGLKDSIPPSLVNSSPKMLQNQFVGKDIELTFNEYVVAENLSSKLIVSPPLAKKPTVRIKGKSIDIKIDEDLIPDRTYTFDFGDGIKDYTEGNKIKGLKLIFATGPHLDSLRISGYIYDAASLVPVPEAIATLYSFDNDSLFRNLHPDFIARADEKGFFQFDNLPKGRYMLYGLKDDDKNLFYSSATELISFSDSMISPSAIFIPKIDTLISGKDTVISHGHTKFSPEILNLLLFTDENHSQYLVSFKRESAEKCSFIFHEPVIDSLDIGIVGKDSLHNWNEMEYSRGRDTVSLWITDTILASTDTLFFKIKHPVSDSTGNIVLKTDTLKMLNVKSAPPSKQGKKKPIPDDKYFRFSNNLASTGFDLNSSINLEAPAPLVTPEDTIFYLDEMVNDSTPKPVAYSLEPVEGSRRKFRILFQEKENTKYKLSLDTASIKTVTGIPNAGFSTKFTTQKKDYYGSIIINISGIDRNGIIQLVKNDKQESLVRQIPFSPSKKTLAIEYLKPDKYLLKFIDDLNGNGKWDTGKLSKRRQPEPIYYFEKELNVKSNWEMKESWSIKPGTLKGKPVLEEKKEKKNESDNR